MINQIKQIVKNYINNAKLCSLTEGEVVGAGVKISDVLTVPSELISGDLKKYTAIGDRVKLIRNHGGQEFYIVEIIGKEFVTKGSTLTLRSGEYTYKYKVEDVTKNDT